MCKVFYGEYKKIESVNLYDVHNGKPNPKSPKRHRRPHLVPDPILPPPSPQTHLQIMTLFSLLQNPNHPSSIPNLSIPPHCHLPLQPFPLRPGPPRLAPSPTHAPHQSPRPFVVQF
ncbi:hypothetical protein Drorol1_Dr00004686 [Drosera rotundifolia]